MKTLIHYLFIILFIFCSCSKEDIGEAVTAGNYDTNFIYHEFSPPLKVELTLDALTDNYLGSDSIDINPDKDFDLILSHRIHLPPESGNPSYEHFPYFRLILKNGLQVATKVCYYPVGLGQVNDVNWVDPLNYKSQIDKRLDWSESNVTQMMWAIPPVSNVPYSPWHNLTNEEKYIGIRMKIGSENKYGWIKVNVITRENMQFLSYALEK